MKIGLNTDSLGELSLDAMLDVAGGARARRGRVPDRRWSAAPHVDLDALLVSEAARRELLARVADRGLAISALTCNGNQLDPVSGRRPRPRRAQHDRARAAARRRPRDPDVRLPGGPGDKWANWITVAWPPEAAEVLRWQWEESVIPYWRSLVAHAEEHGVAKLCLEMHGQQVVYNVPTLLRLREAVGPVVGANYDPSHLMWMGADPIAAIDALGDAIYHVHAKDTRIEPAVALHSRLETLADAHAAERAWNYVTLGHGHDAEFWREFCAALQRAGYDDVLSIEHEDQSMDPVEAVTESVASSAERRRSARWWRRDTATYGAGRPWLGLTGLQLLEVAQAATRGDCGLPSQLREIGDPRDAAVHYSTGHTVHIVRQEREPNVSTNDRR